MMRHVVSIDLETTSLDERRGGIVSIGAAYYGAPEDAFYRELTITEDCLIDPEALRVNGETEQGLRVRKADASREYITPATALTELLDWCRERDLHVILGKNPSFDYRFLRAKWCGLGRSQGLFEQVLSYRTIDWSGFAIPLMLYLGWEIPPHGLSSIDIARFLQMPDEARPHNALNGARYNLFAVQHIMRKYEENS